MSTTTTSHPADTAKPGDPYVDENGVTWILLGDLTSEKPWFTVSLALGNRWHSRDEARKHTLTPLVSALTPEGVDPIEEWKAAADDRVKVAKLLGVDCEIDAILPAIRRMQQDLDPRYAGTPAAIAENLHALAASDTEYTVMLGGVKMAKVDSNGQTEAGRLVDRLRERLRVSDWLIAEAHFDRDMAERQLSDAWDALDWDVPDIPLDDAIRDLRQRVDDAATLPTPDASNPAQLRHAAAIVREVSYSCTSEWEDELQEVSDFVAARADRLDADAADRDLAEKIAQEQWDRNRDYASPWREIHGSPARQACIEAAAAGIRAGRDAAKAVQS